jgi:predicted PurR-regulated permease PerM
MTWSFWDVLWTTFVIFVWAMFLVILINVVIDLFRSHDIGGWAKALWIIVIIVLPLLGVLIYLIVRGGGMAERAQAAQKAQVERYVGNAGTPTDQIAQAKSLLDAGAIEKERTLGGDLVYLHASDGARFKVNAILDEE